MLLSIQYPIADARGFVAGDFGRLDRPNWPSPLPDKQYVRFVGVVQKRPRGGLTGWGDDLYCAANRALKFVDHQPYARLGLRTRGAFRRFYFDGYAVARFELGVSIDMRFSDSSVPASNLPATSAAAQLEQFLTGKIGVSDASGGHTITTPAQAGDDLSTLYYRATTKKKVLATAQKRPWSVSCGAPILFLERLERDVVEFPYAVHPGPPIRDEYGIAIELREVRLGKRSFPMWVMTLKDGFNHTVARHLRLSLTRLHAEFECLGFIFNSMTPAKITLDGDTSRLEDYLDVAYCRVKSSESTTRKLSGGDRRLADLALSIGDAITPGRRDSLLLQLNKTSTSLRRRTEAILQKKGQVGFIMQDFRGAQIGAINTGSGTVNQQSNVFNATYLQDVDLDALRQELLKLQTYVNAKEDAPEKQQAADAVSKALAGAESNDKKSVWDALRSGGAWLLGAARDIGVPLAIHAIGAAVGIPV